MITKQNIKLLNHQYILLQLRRNAENQNAMPPWRSFIDKMYFHFHLSLFLEVRRICLSLLFPSRFSTVTRK